MEACKLTICRCEEITEADLRSAIVEWGITDVNELKLISRAGKGVCQGRTCSHLLERILITAAGKSPAELKPLPARIPVRPIPVVALSRDSGVASEPEVTLTMMEITDEDRHLRRKEA